jgi:hypothetical protein
VAALQPVSVARLKSVLFSKRSKIGSGTFSTRIVGRFLPHGIGEFPHEPHQFVDIRRRPCAKDGAADPIPRLVHGVSHRLTLLRDDGFAHAAVGSLGPARDQAEAFELRDLPAP